MKPGIRVRPMTAWEAGLRHGLFFGLYMTVVYWVTNVWWNEEPDWRKALVGGLVSGAVAGLLFGVSMGRMMRPLVRTVHMEDREVFQRQLVEAARRIKYQPRDLAADTWVFRPAWFLGFPSSLLVVDLAPGQATLAGPRPMVKRLLEDLGKN